MIQSSEYLNNSNEKSATVESSTGTSLEKRKHEQFVSSEGTSSDALPCNK
jgi:phosphopantetheine adenylyltransferase